MRLFLERFKPTNARSFARLWGISPVKWLPERSMNFISPNFFPYSQFCPFHANIVTSTKYKVELSSIYPLLPYKRDSLGNFIYDKVVM